MPEEHAEIDRLRSLASKLAAKLGLAEEDAKALDIAASMIGVGRLPLMDIMDKDGPLTTADRARMEATAGIWADFAGQVGLLRELGVSRLLETYTECWDGTGRPAGLSGDEIPVGARILGVCYHYNGMISDRGYRKALPYRRAVSELTRLSGTVLDPDVVTIFAAMLEDERTSRRTASRRMLAEKEAREEKAAGKAPREESRSAGKAAGEVLKKKKRVKKKPRKR